MPFTAKLRFGSEGSRGSSLAQAPTDQESTTILETLFVIFLLPSPGICQHAILTMVLYLGRYGSPYNATDSWGIVYQDYEYLFDEEPLATRTVKYEL
ncbi:hypothetical protein POX_a01509 [Penicillium oxalicum]|uniref:hypothetical protein n=1 Tax=Penicillium oxalicum TaxID=69781 RepID=UPI0020B7BB67|nr:hypothetical protein POX_a01509 [Penicillium oxalicum]KAI2794908.1 hypothetical protein POX_a01509 [Penicillium oxalicum]